jgi:hypothetical protein
MSIYIRYTSIRFEYKQLHFRPTPRIGTLDRREHYANSVAAVERVESRFSRRNDCAVLLQRLLLLLLLPSVSSAPNDRSEPKHCDATAVKRTATCLQAVIAEVNVDRVHEARSRKERTLNELRTGERVGIG